MTIIASKLSRSDVKSWRRLAHAFYALAHNDSEAWNSLPDELKRSDAGLLCEKYLQNGNRDLIEEAGILIAGKNWYVAIGR